MPPIIGSAHTPILLAKVVPELSSLVSALLYSLIGIALFGLAFFIIVKVAPFSLRKEIEEDQNTSLGILMGCTLIALAIVLASAIKG